MSLENIHLYKLLRLMYAPPKEKKSKLRKEIYQDIKKENGTAEGGMDFYSPFWADAKKHVAEAENITAATSARISKNARRERIYTNLNVGFLSWWNEKRRWWNEPVMLEDSAPKSSLGINALGAEIKVENFIPINIGNEKSIAVYPYFYDEPKLSADAARLAFWVMQKSSLDFPIEDILILDISEGESYSISECPLKGNEEELLISGYNKLLQDYSELRLEYD